MVTVEQVKEALEELVNSIGCVGDGEILADAESYGKVNTSIGSINIEHTLDVPTREVALTQGAVGFGREIVQGYVKYEVDGETYSSDGYGCPDIEPKFYKVEELLEAIKEVGGKVISSEEYSDEEFYEEINESFNPLAEAQLIAAAKDAALIEKLTNAINESGEEVDEDDEEEFGCELLRLIGVEREEEMN